MVLDKLPKRTNAYYDSSIETWRPGKGVIFVAGTNLQGRHGAGAALAAAKYYGAPEGHCEGHVGDYYGIPTRNIIGPRQLETLPLSEIYYYVREFTIYTLCSPFTFLVTPIGTGRAGYHDSDIAYMFSDVENCWLPDKWQEYLE